MSGHLFTPGCGCTACILDAELDRIDAGAELLEPAPMTPAQKALWEEGEKAHIAPALPDWRAPHAHEASRSIHRDEQTPHESITEFCFCGASRFIAHTGVSQWVMP